MTYFHPSVVQVEGRVRFFNEVTSELLEKKLKMPDVTKVPMLRGLGIDLETDSNDPLNAQITEIALREFYFHRDTYEFIGLGKSYQSLNEIDGRIPSEVTELTGIRDIDIKGKRINWDVVNDMFMNSHLVVAHNASFERVILSRQKQFKVKKKIWGCTLNMIAWDKRFNGKGLENLVNKHGLGYDAHRALIDTDVMCYLLSLDNYLFQLLNYIKKEHVLIIAYNTDPKAYETLRSMGYRWYNNHETKEKFMYKEVEESLLPHEKKLLKEVAYVKRSSRNARYVKLDAFNRCLHVSHYTSKKIMEKLCA